MGITGRFHARYLGYPHASGNIYFRRKLELQMSVKQNLEIRTHAHLIFAWRCCIRLTASQSCSAPPTAAAAAAAPTTTQRRSKSNNNWRTNEQNVDNSSRVPVFIGLARITAENSGTVGYNIQCPYTQDEKIECRSVSVSPK